MYVVIWEPRSGRGGGHQLVTDLRRADEISRRLSRERPGDMVRVETAEAWSAAAVLERGQQQRRRPGAS
jgi:hypothetical protein